MKDSTGSEDKKGLFDAEDGGFFRFRLSNRNLAIGCAAFFLLVVVVSAALDLYLGLSNAGGSADVEGKDLHVTIGKGELHINGEETDQLSYILKKSSKISLEEQEKSLSLAAASGILTLTLPRRGISSVTIDAGNASVMLYDIGTEDLIVKSSASVDADRIDAGNIAIHSAGNLILTNSIAEKAELKTQGSLTTSESSFSSLRIEVGDDDASILGGNILSLEAESGSADIYFYPGNGVSEAAASSEGLAAINFDGNTDTTLKDFSRNLEGGAVASFSSNQGVLEI